MIRSSSPERRAEARRLARQAGSSGVVALNGLSSEEVSASLGELAKYQAELEAQNEELRALQQDLERLARRYQDLFETAPVGYFTLDDQGFVVEVNPLGARLLGGSQESILGRALAGFLTRSSADELHRRLLASRDGPVDSGTALLTARAQPDRFLHLENVSIDHRPGERRARVTLSDVTELRSAQKVEAISVLAAGVAHDFNNMLATVQGNAELGLVTLGRGGRAEPHFEAIFDACRAAAGMVERLVRLSLGPLAVDAQTMAVASPPLSQGRETRGRVAVVDDEPAIVEMITMALEHHGLEVTGFLDGELALAALSQSGGEYAVVITDQTMPGRSGISLAREVRRLRPSLPILLCSGLVDDQLLNLASEVGVREVLAKPVVLAKLLAAVTRVLPS